MIVRASLLILATVAALAASGNGVGKPPRKRKPRLESSDEEDANRGSRHAEETEEENKTEDADRQQVIARQDEAEETKRLLNDLRRREIAVEHKLLEIYGLREQHSFIVHLKRQLRVRSSEADVLKAAVGSLEAEKSHLEKDIRESLTAEKQLVTAEEMIERCREKLKADEIQLKAQLEMIEEQVHGYRSRGKQSREPAFEGKTKTTTDDAKLEVVAMKRRNKELELEKRELGLKLNAARAKAAALTAMTEGEAIAGAKEEADEVKCRNRDLLKQIEMLQKQRFGMVEELVYQKWLNSCLRFEIRDYQTPPPRYPKCDPSKDWSVGGRAASDSANSSCTSMESCEIDDTSSTLGSTSGSHSSISKRSSLITKIKRWRNKSKGNVMADQSPERSPGKRFPAKSGLIRRFLTSVVPEGPSKARWNLGTGASRKTSKKDLVESPSLEAGSRPRRVSFNDRVRIRNLEPAFEDTLMPVETEPFSPGKCDGTSSQMVATELRDGAAVTVTAKETAGKNGDVTASEATRSSQHRGVNELEQNATNDRAADKIGPTRLLEVQSGQMSRIEARSPRLVSAVVIFIFMLLLVPRFCSWLYFTLMAH
ncbi:hypothetical protein BT93_L5673 [Corymbia citriodora subsp. variegata]|uniref:Protein CHUP1, chloroplastic n=1 Tax=Corymbia citriodora subsp. variegata TaxID=360336 RepID=A0A8T0CRM6_CORYI|nr:hypothetical protein BT93_L5673 [Corymbia citriodora subsp. variegata]